MFIQNVGFATPISSVNSSGGTVSGEFSLEAGENLSIGDPLKVTANKFYRADAATDSRIVGLSKATYGIGTIATGVFSGELDGLSSLSPWSPYYMNTGGGISTTPPSSGYLMQIGTAISSSSIIINIEDSVLLS